MKTPRTLLHVFQAFSTLCISFRFAAAPVARHCLANSPVLVTLTALSLIGAMLAPGWVEVPREGVALSDRAGGHAETPSTVTGLSRSAPYLTRTSILLADLDDEARTSILEEIRQGAAEARRGASSMERTTPTTSEPRVIKTVYAESAGNCGDRGRMEMRVKPPESVAVLPQPHNDIAEPGPEDLTQLVGNFREAVVCAGLPRVPDHDRTASAGYCSAATVVFVGVATIRHIHLIVAEERDCPWSSVRGTSSGTPHP